jgi:predicted nucleic acid-binding protein
VTLVVDASVALKWFLSTEPDADRALEVVRSGERLCAPDLLVVEVCNAAWKSVRLGRISQLRADQIAASLPRFLDTLAEAAPLAQRAVTIAAQLDHPVYDALYLALAEREQAKLVTADSRLLGKIQSTVWEPDVIALASYKIAPQFPTA